MIKRFLYEEDGLSTIEIAIIVAVLLAIALAFRKTMINFCKALAARVLGN